MSEVSLLPPVPPTGPRRTAVALKGLTLITLAGLLAFITSTGRELVREWSRLTAESSRARATVVVGYPGIGLRVSSAAKPPDWIHDDGDSTLIWCGWKEGAGHQWFRVGRGEINPSLMSNPLGRDTVQPIDDPVVERGGGTYWARIPEKAAVAGQRLAGVDTAYPLAVLDKVVVVNDTIAGTPYLVTNNPTVGVRDQVFVYETVLDGRRITMGVTGYLHDRKPLLFDRGTESLWVGEPDALLALAGKHKGRRLRRVAHLTPVDWGLWRSEHPDSRLVVGARRERPAPEL